MTRLLRAAFLLPCAALALSGPAAAEAQAPAGQYYVVHQEVAKPSMLKEYEAASKEFVAMVKANKAKMPHFSFDCIVSPDFTYTFVTPVPNFAGLDAINADFGALAQSAGPRFLDLMKRGGAATEYIKDSVVQRVPELSYTPAQPRLRPGQARYFHHTYYYVMPGREADVDALAADYVKLFRARGVTTGYDLYKVVLGPEMPLYVSSIAALDAADFYAEDAKVLALLGADFQVLGERAMALTRRFEIREAVLRPDLSVPAR
jgi:hypothetical protein